MPMTSFRSFPSSLCRATTILGAVALAAAVLTGLVAAASTGELGVPAAASSALALALGGGALLALDRRRRLARALAIGILVLAVGVIAWELVGPGATPGDEGSYGQPSSAPLEALLPLLIGIGVLLVLGRKVFAFLGALLSCAVVVIAVVATLAALVAGPGSYAWGPVGRLPLPVSLGFLALAGGLLAAATQRRGAEETLRSWGRPLVVGTAIMLVGALLWPLLRSREQDRARDALEVNARLVRYQIQSRLATVVNELRDLGRVGVASGWPDERRWQVDWRVVLSQVPGFQRVEWIEPDGDVHLMVTADTLRSLGQTPDVQGHYENAMQQARESGLPAVAGPFPFEADDAPGGDGEAGVAFRVVIPVSAAEAGAASPLIAGVLDAATTFADVADSPPAGYDFVVQSGGHEIFRASAGAEPGLAPLLVELPIRLAGRDIWSLLVSPQPAVLAANMTALPETTLLAVLLVAFVLTSALRTAETARLEAARFREAVGERTAELEVAKAEAEAANAAKDRFLLVLGHELRNPLGSMRTALEVLRLRSGGEEDEDETVALIERQLGHLSRRIDDLLDVSRIAAGRVSVELERVDLATMVRDTAAGYRSQALEAGLELRLELPDEPLWVDADSNRVAEVVENLLANAIKYTEDHGDRVEVIVRARDDEAEVVVRDTGRGLREDELELIFDPFVRATGGSDGDGLGIGLYVARQLVEALGGRIRARSEGVGRGAEFVFSLPLREAPAEGPRGAAGATAAENGEGRRAGPSYRILVVDDHPDSRESLAELLALHGHRVDVAADGPAALSAVRRSRPDVVLCDINLPGMDGYEVMRRLRHDPEMVDVRIVALSGRGESAAVRRSLQLGCDDHLVKPVDPDELLSAVATPPPAPD